MATLTQPATPVHARRPLSAGGFSEWIDREADRQRVRGDAWSLWLAAKLRELGDLARFVHAADPEAFEDRVPVLEDARVANLAAQALDRAS